MSQSSTLTDFPEHPSRVAGRCPTSCEGVGPTLVLFPALMLGGTRVKLPEANGTLLALRAKQGRWQPQLEHRQLVVGDGLEPLGTALVLMIQRRVPPVDYSRAD